MMQAENVPEHDIAVFDRPVLGNEVRNASFAGRMIDELARRESLLRLVGRDPEMVLDKTGALTGRRVRADEGRDTVERFELVSDRRPGVIEPGGVDDLPIALRCLI